MRHISALHLNGIPGFPHQSIRHLAEQGLEDVYI